MLIQLQPCVAGWSPAEILTASGAVLTACLTAFLSYRRVKADKVASDRFFINGLRAAKTHDELDQLRQAVLSGGENDGYNTKGRSQ